MVAWVFWVVARQFLECCKCSWVGCYGFHKLYALIQVQPFLFKLSWRSALLMFLLTESTESDIFTQRNNSLLVFLIWSTRSSNQYQQTLRHNRKQEVNLLLTESLFTDHRKHTREKKQEQQHFLFLMCVCVCVCMFNVTETQKNL